MALQLGHHIRELHLVQDFDLVGSGGGTAALTVRAKVSTLTARSKAQCKLRCA